MATAKSTVSGAQINADPANVPIGIAGLLDSVQCLSDRERAVLSLLVGGTSLQPIGKRLGISKQAVHKLSVKAVRKIGAELRPGLAIAPGAIERFRAMLRAEGAERLRERGRGVYIRELRTVAAK